MRTLGWLKLDAYNIWNHWLKDAFLESLRLGLDSDRDKAIRRYIWNNWLKDAFLESLRLGLDSNQDGLIQPLVFVRCSNIFLSPKEKVYHAPSRL